MAQWIGQVQLADGVLEGPRSMLLQTTSYIVPKDKRAEHARVLRRFRQTLQRLGCDHFEVYEQVGANWNVSETTGRFVQILRFRDRKHHQAIQHAERNDPQVQQVVAEFCNLINLPYQQQQGLFAVGFYTSFMKLPSQRSSEPQSGDAPAEEYESVDMNEPTPTESAISSDAAQEAASEESHQGIWATPSHAAEAAKTAPQETGPSQV
ncbi:MAG: hypothetical protein ABSH22_15785 [Tepidisphaeraceae bacterium]